MRVCMFDWRPSGDTIGQCCNCVVLATPGRAAPLAAAEPRAAVALAHCNAIAQVRRSSPPRLSHARPEPTVHLAWLLERAVEPLRARDKSARPSLALGCTTHRSSSRSLVTLAFETAAMYTVYVTSSVCAPRSDLGPPHSRPDAHRRTVGVVALLEHAHRAQRSRIEFTDRRLLFARVSGWQARSGAVQLQAQPTLLATRTTSLGGGHEASGGVRLTSLSRMVRTMHAPPPCGAWFQREPAVTWAVGGARVVATGSCNARAAQGPLWISSEWCDAQ